MTPTILSAHPGRSRRFAAVAGAVSLSISLSVALSASRFARAAGGDAVTIAGSEIPGSSNGTGRAASFRYPWAIVSDANGNAYVADTDNNLIRKVVLATGVVSTVAGDGVLGSDDGAATTASFNFPSGLAFVNPTTLAIADSFNRKIRLLNLSASTVSTLAGSGSFGMTDGVGASAEFGTPYDIASDGSGNLYVADGGVHLGTNLGTNSIRKINVVTAEVSTVAGTGSYGVANGPTATAEFRQPHGLAVAGNYVYVADRQNNTIRRIDLVARTVQDFAGSGIAGFRDGPAVDAQFDAPHRVIVDGNRLLVADTNNNRIRAIDLQTNMVSTLSGSGAAGLSSGTASTAQYWSPTGIAVDSSGYLLVADTFNHSIRAVESGSPINKVLVGVSSSAASSPTASSSAASSAPSTTKLGNLEMVSTIPAYTTPPSAAPSSIASSTPSSVGRSSVPPPLTLPSVAVAAPAFDLDDPEVGGVATPGSPEELALTGSGSVLLFALALCFTGSGVLLVTRRRARSGGLPGPGSL